MVGTAQTLVILTAGIDLSVGAIMVLCSVVMGQFAMHYGVPAPVAVAVGLLVGALCGFINGFLIARVKLPPFIVTLGTWQIYAAINFIYSGNETIRSQDLETKAPLLQFFGNSFKVGGAVFTYGVMLVLIMRRSLWYVLNHTAWGRHVYAVGDDPGGGRTVGRSRRQDAARGLYAHGHHLRDCRLGPDRAHRIGVADMPASSTTSTRSPPW